MHGAKESNFRQEAKLQKMQRVILKGASAAGQILAQHRRAALVVRSGRVL
jgi:hypothetical protein